MFARPHLKSDYRMRPFMFGRILLLATMLGSATAMVARADSWTDATGKFTIEAQFLALRGDTVYLKKENGVTIAVPLTKLNAASQQLARRAAAAPPVGADTPDAAFRLMQEAVQGGNFRVVWDSLPASYQKDVNDVIRTFGQNMDAALWRSGTGVVKKAVAVCKQKKEFILGHPALSAAPVGEEVISGNWDTVVALLDTIVNSELTDLEKLKTFDVEQFIAGTGTKISQQMVALTKALDGDGVRLDESFGEVAMVPLQFAGAKFSTVSVAGDTAVVRVEKSDGETEELEVVRVDGKWVPKSMADQWAEGIAAAKGFLSTELKTQLQENKAAMMLPMTMVGGVLDQLLAATTQDEFNQVVDQILALMQPENAGPPGADPFGAGPPPAKKSADPFGADPFGN
jgi:hypothetical protein